MHQIQIKAENLSNSYQVLFKKKLTPKFNFLTHYPTIMNKSAPLRNLWYLKYEGKLKPFKIYANVITSRKNAPLSFSYKQQMYFSNILSEKKSHEEFIFKKQQFDINIKTIIKKKTTNSMTDIFYIFGGRDMGIHIKLFNILLIKKTERNKIYLCCNEIYKIYNHHYTSFECGNVLNEKSILNLSGIVGPPVELFVTPQVTPFYKTNY